jgi:hypothetical protein
MKDNLFEDMRELLQAQVKEAYMEGAHSGAVTTCAVIYATMRAAGLEENNILYTILKDIAKQHGCEDLIEVINRLK